jgi:asparagine synthase (glutamine-hydrolysing)
MCGIWLLLGRLRSEHHAEFLKIVGRGPDLTVLEEVKPNAWLGFHRLAIVEPGDQASEQPIVHGGAAVVCNGEIYNHLAIKADSGVDELTVLNGGSDCAAILHAFRKHKGDLAATCADLDGVFAFAMLDDEFLYLGRDPMGVRPLFYGFSEQGTTSFLIIFPFSLYS